MQLVIACFSMLKFFLLIMTWGMTLHHHHQYTSPSPINVLLLMF